nr:immunoglobulin light chain junction region [Macaca mulatta]MOW03576.1 immunoglobulin light chain junction region [Macaca mulatta]
DSYCRSDENRLTTGLF